MRALVGWTVLLCCLTLPAWGETTESIPRPAPGSWTVDTTGTLTASTLAELEQVASAVNAAGTGQLAIVMVRTVGDEVHRDFATRLFNQWGIGHAGRNDGVLLLVALQDRKVEIILGDGVDGRDDVARSDAVMANRIVPAFKRGDPNGAVLAGAQGLRELLELSVPDRPEETSSSMPTAPGFTQEAVETGSLELPVHVTDNAPWYLGGGAGTLLAGGMGVRRWLRRRPRICQGCKQPRNLLDEKADDVHLNEGSRVEETIGSVDYDVWWCDSCQDAQVERYGTLFTSYSKCPSCSFKTKQESSRTLVSATYDHGGKVEVTVTCKNCPHHNQFTRSTPKLTRSSSSSSSSSRSSGSSFGGGRSSGGGSSGSW